MTLKAQGAGSFDSSRGKGVFFPFEDGMQLQRLWVPGNLIQLYTADAAKPLSVWDMDGKVQRAGAASSLVVLADYWAAALDHVDGILKELRALHRKPGGSFALAEQYMVPTRQDLQYLRAIL